MELRFNLNEKIQEVEVGDVVVLDNDKKYLIVNDFCGRDYRAINLVDNQSTSCENTIPAMIKSITERVFDGCKIIKIIKANELYMGVK